MKAFDQTLKIAALFALLQVAAICTARADTLFAGISGTTTAINTIAKITSDGTATIFASGLNGPDGLAFDKNGSLYVVNNGDNTILKFAADGTSVVFANSGLDGPDYIAFEPVSHQPSPQIQIQPASQVGYWGRDVSFTVCATVRPH